MLAAYVVAYAVLGWKVVFTALRNLTKGQIFDENFLMSVATLGAFAIKSYPEAVGVMLFYRIGEYFEEKAVERSPVSYTHLDVYKRQDDCPYHLPHLTADPSDCLNYPAHPSVPARCV